MSKKTGGQEFGSAHTQVKLGAIANYLPAFTTALSKQRFKLHYIDAFAGTGKCTIKTGFRNRTIPGSAMIALECDPPFHKLLLIEKSRKKAKELEQLVAFSQKAATVMKADANVAVPEYLATLTASDRAIIFLDPFGMQVAWETLQKIAATEKADVWYLFPLSGLYRQATRKAEDIDPSKAAALTRALGPHDWRTALYTPPRQPDMYKQASDEREANPLQLAEWVTGCLKGTFPGVVGPKILYMERRNGKKGAPLFALYCLISNPAAVKVASRIATSVLKL